MANYEKNTLLYTGDAQGNKVKCYPTTKAEYVEGLKEFIDSNESGESENNGNSGVNTFNRYATIVIGTTKSGYTADDVDYLCTGSNDDVVINSAIAMLVNGGKILLLEGTYVLSGNIVIDKNNVTLEGMGASTVIDRGSISGGRYCVYVNGVDGCEIKHVKCINSGYGIYLYDSVNCNVSNCICTNNWCGVYVNETTNVKIDSCTLDNNTYYGIYYTRGDIDYDDNIFITNNSCSNNQIGIYIYPSLNKGTAQDAWDSFNINIINNTCNNNTTTTNSAIYARGLNDGKIIGNTCNDNGYNGIDVQYSKNVIVSSNCCMRNTKYGIREYYGISGGGSLFNGNMCDDNTSYGMYFLISKSTSYVITSNKSNTGIYTSQTPDVFENNLTT